MGKNVQMVELECEWVKYCQVLTLALDLWLCEWFFQVWVENTCKRALCL